MKQKKINNNIKEIIKNIKNSTISYTCNEEPLCKAASPILDSILTVIR